jgi:hypothetical protein
VTQAGGGVSASLNQTDEADTMAATATVAQPAPEVVNLGGRRLFGMATWSTDTVANITDEADTVSAYATIEQGMRAAMGVTDEADTTTARCVARWPAVKLMRSGRKPLAMRRD